MNYKKLLQKYTKRSKRGLSLVELVATIAVLAITSGAVFSVYLMVQKVTWDASEITKNQYNVSQMERIIRNELQVASNIDIDLLASYQQYGAHYDSIQENDEYMMYDTVRREVVFYRADSSSSFNKVFSIGDVSDVTVSIAPLNDMAANKEGMPYKLFYKISTRHYDYSGGFVLNNTMIGMDDSMKSAPSQTMTIRWGDTPGGDNDFVLFFHRETTNVEDTP